MKEANIGMVQPTSEEHHSYARQAIIDLLDTLRDQKQRTSGLKNLYQSLEHQLLELIEFRHVLIQTAMFFEQAEDKYKLFRIQSMQDMGPLFVDYEANRDIESSSTDRLTRLHYLMGVISKDLAMTFERILWRVSRGNLLIQFATIPEPVATDPSNPSQTEYKVTFTVFTHSQQLLKKCERILNGLNGRAYAAEVSASKRSKKLTAIAENIDNLNTALDQARHISQEELKDIKNIVHREKAIYCAMNMFNFDPNRQCMIAEAWCAKNQVDMVQAAITRVTLENTMSPILTMVPSTHRTPPTCHPTNKFTRPFQELVDTYEQLCQIKDEIFKIFYHGKYMLLMMGIFSMYTGWVYNDFFSLSLFMASSEFDLPANYSTNETTLLQSGYAYPSGIDPR
ncbi:V-type ATPase 116kDa subunit family-domain-containing protein [Gilbertella persicaria]|uniref:V-type ATPase 116kDa subunit family-domain-containing protein n=1 Tax=Gilbertella persicaria TaxID=101096 RepID=UPI002221014F|nr:V-type ATPase 116kDa subunit family-domain-containing protein [Gilbertella persicaria]KAI8051374.1 V-type ATPase 116kDa subunit family-domain-containing protein [Gilbertella persicaria]